MPSAVSAALQPAVLEFAADGTPVSSAYGDVYHAAQGGPAQARHVFLAGNGLPARWAGRARFTVLETGFGLGLNFLSTWAAWRTDPARCARLDFVSVEKHPFQAADLARAHAGWFAAWPEAAALSAELCAAWPALTPGAHTLELAGGALRLTLLLGDACEVLPGAGGEPRHVVGGRWAASGAGGGRLCARTPAGVCRQARDAGRAANGGWRGGRQRSAGGRKQLK